jgi:hypothetical protein
VDGALVGRWFTVAQKVAIENINPNWTPFPRLMLPLVVGRVKPGVKITCLFFIEKIP